MATPFNVRMEDSLRDQIHERVDAGEASNQSEWAREALAGVVALGGLPALSRAIELVGGDTSENPHPARARVLQSRPAVRGRTLDECPHPDGQRIKTAFSERCSLCGVTLRDDVPAEPLTPEPVDVLEAAHEFPRGETQAVEAMLGMTSTGDEIDVLDLAGGPAES